LRRFRLIVTLALIACLTTSVLPHAALAGARPDVFGLFALVAALWGRRDRALAVAWAAGLAKDLCSQGPLGAHAALFLLMAVVVLRVRGFFNVHLLRVQLILAVAAGGACQTLYAGTLWLFHPQMGASGALGRAVWVTLLTAPLLPLGRRAGERLLKALRVAAEPGWGRA